MIYQYATNYIDRDIFVFINAENEIKALTKAFDKLGCVSEQMTLVNTFKPVTFSEIISNLKLNFTELNGSKKSYIRDTWREYDQGYIKIVCCGLAAHITTEKETITYNLELFDKYFTNSMINRFID